MKNCYIYTRVSTDAQIKGYSLDAQQERLRQFADYKGLRIAREYCDAGKSGHSIKGRPAFREMMGDIIDQKDQVSFVLVFKLSRFGRNAADILKSVQTLMDYDVELVCVEDAIDSSTQGGRLTIAILSAVAEMERENIKDQFIAGRMQKVLTGGWPGGPVPFGYRSVEKQLVVDPEEAEVVKMIYRLYLRDDMSARSVVNFMNDSGYRRKRGDIEKPFTYDFITTVLDNPIYSGQIAYGHRSNRKNSQPDSEDVINVKGIHEPIVTESQWDEVRRKRLKLSVKPVKKGDPDQVSLLAGLVKCPLCGAGMYSIKNRKINKQKGGYYKDHYSYACVNYRKAKGRTCEFQTTYNQHKVDDAVFEIFSKLTLLPEFRKAVEDNIGDQSSAEALEEEAKALRKQLRREEQKLKKLSEELDSLDVFAINYDEQYSMIEERMDTIYDCMDQYELKLNDTVKKLNSVRKGIQAAKQATDMLGNIKELYGKMSCREKREMYRLFIERIEVYPKRDDGRILKSITFRIPVVYEGENGIYDSDSGEHISFEVDCEQIGKTAAEAKATYPQIKSFVSERYGVKVSSLYIAQTKRKYGIGMRENYNKPEKPDGRQPQCPPEKEKMIVDALIHYKMLNCGTGLRV